jgi:two-component system sensor histidine kinase RpfC
MIPAPGNMSNPASHCGIYSAAADARPQSGLCILVAEDNATSGKLIVKILERRGHHVQLVDHGEAALEALRNTIFDIALFDIDMPGLDGIETMSERLSRPNLPLVALVADATVVKASSEAAGIDTIVAKPIDPARLIEVVESYRKKLFSSGGDILHSRKAEPIANRSSNDENRPKDTRTTEAPAIDQGVLDDLEKLGGKTFVDEVVSQFIADAAIILEGLSEAATQRDIEGFRDLAHALRSCAANVGAREIYEKCLSWRAIEAEELARTGEEYVKQLKSGFDDTRHFLDGYEHPPVV